MVTIEKWGNLEKCYYRAHTCVVPPFICNNEHLIEKKTLVVLKFNFEQDFRREFQMGSVVLKLIWLVIIFILKHILWYIVIMINFEWIITVFSWDTTTVWCTWHTALMTTTSSCAACFSWGLASSADNFHKFSRSRVSMVISRHWNLFLLPSRTFYQFFNSQPNSVIFKCGETG